jgi:phosphate transport system permease protein
MATQLRGSVLPKWFAGALAALSIAAALLIERTTSVAGIGGTITLAVLLYLVLQTTWSFTVEGRRHAVDRLFATLIYSSFVAAALPLATLIWQVVSKGIAQFNADFLTHSMRSVSPSKPGGGVYHALLGTLEQVGIATLIAVPIGILTALYLVEYARGGRLARAISFFVDVMTGVPSIVAGLFIYTAFVLTFGFERSGFAAALSLTILMLPVIVRATEEMLKIVPMDLREASLALGIPKWKTILRIVLPTAIGGIITGVMLAVARVAGETAPLLLTTFLSQSINQNPFNGPQAAIPTFIWDQISSATPASLDRAWAGALTLILLIMIFYGTAKLIARYYAPKA